MLKKLLWTLLGLIIMAPIVAILAGVKLDQFKTMGEAAAEMEVPPEVVNATTVREVKWQSRASAVGSVTAVQGIVVSTEADGVVREIKFEPGSSVKAGDLLVQLDVDVEQAQLRAAEASGQLAVVSFKRAKELIESQNISQAEFDTAAAALQEAQAQIDNLRAVIAKKAVRAPFAGKLGIRQINIGQFLQKGSPVVSLQALDPVFVEFSLPQQRLGELAEGQKVVVTTDAYKAQEFDGKITAINPNIDANTRSMRVQATLPNKDQRLRPGMYVSVDVILSKVQDVLVIPETAVVHAPYGDSVFIIDEETTRTKSGETTKTLTVRQQFVRLGERQGDFVVATKGLKLGQRIVSAGVFKLRPETHVVIDNTLAPEFKMRPTPDNT